MSSQDALVNFAISMVVMPPFMLLGAYVFRNPRVGSKTRIDKIRRLKIQLPAAVLVLLGGGFIVWNGLNLLLALG